MSGRRREAESFRRKLERLGFTVTRSRSGHWKVRYPDHPTTYVLAHSPTDSRSLDNARSDIRRMFGIDI